MKHFASIACAVLTVACRSAEPTRTAVDPDDTLVVSFEASAKEEPAGWIYAFDRGELADLCVYVWPDARWTLAAETAQGHYGTLIAEGTIEHGRARGFPEGLLETSRTLYVAGRVEASLAGRDLPRTPDGGSR